MDVATALLVLGSALLHALWNALLKRTRAPEDAVVGVVLVSAASAVTLALATRAPLPGATSIAWCVLSGVLEAFYFVTLARALARAPLGPVYTTVRGGALVVVWPIAIALLGERMTAPIAAGTFLVAVGLVATGAAETPRGRDAEAEGAEPLLRRLGWAAVCALFVGGYQIAYKLALAAGGAPAAVVAISIGSASMANVAALGRARATRAWAAGRFEPVRIGVAGVLTTLGFAMFLVAMTRAGAGVVVTLRNTSILFAQILAFAMGERPKRLGLVGAALVTVGAVLLSR
jgi:drug/metabolite transporter (DMT)-like permease